MTRNIRSLAAACLFSIPILVNADELTVDNATLYGKLEFANGGAPVGGTVTTNGDYTIHTFSNSGTFRVTSGSVTCDVLIVAGGGAGCGGQYHGGGGGAGGIVYATSYVATGNITVEVGAGGEGALEYGYPGEDSSFASMIAVGGGRGASYSYSIDYDGGSGGGGNYAQAPGVTTQTSTYDYAVNYGHDGGTGTSASPNYGSGGGGGAGGAGANGTSTSGGDGGVGIASSISGTEVYYGGGGGGSVYQGGQEGTPGVGGNGGGGAAGDVGAANGVGGTANTGGGGGAADSHTAGIGGDGGSGIVIVRYLRAGTTNVIASIHGINQNSAPATNIFLGKVGIGTNNPAEQLHIVGNFRAGGMIVLTTPPGNLPMGVFTNQ